MALEMAARARLGAAGALGIAARSSPPRSLWGARNSRSSPVGVAGALEMAARAPSASLGRSKWPHEPARLRWGGRNRCSGPLGFAEALTLAARVRSASLGRSKWPLELARLRWGGRNRCSGLLSRPRWGARQRCSSFMRKSCSKTLCSGRDSLWTPGSVRLSSEHGYARVRAGEPGLESPAMGWEIHGKSLENPLTNPGFLETQISAKNQGLKTS